VYDVGTLILDMTYNNANTILQPSAATATLTNTGTLRVSGIPSSGVRSLRVDVVNSGTFALSENAVLDFTGSFTQMSGGTTEFDLASATVFGRMVARNAGSVTINGIAKPVLIGGYTPPVDSVFEVVTSPHTGDYSTVTNGFRSDVTNPASIRIVSGALFHPLAPQRVLDSRPGVGNVGSFTTPWVTGTKRDVAVGGVAGVPANAGAVVLNVTVTGTTGASYLSIWPAGQSQPTVSSLNWTPGQTIPNAVTVKLGAGGKISVFNLSGNVDVIADVAGYYDNIAGDGFTSLSPSRILDSRPGGGNTGGYASPWGSGTKRDVAVGGLQGVPANADAVVLNVTVTGTTGASYLSIWPAGQSQPTASSLNWTPGVTIPNAVTVKLGAGGKISVFNLSGNVDVIADVAGYYQSGTGKAFHPLNPGRVLDSRPGVGNTGGYTTPWGTGTKRDVMVGGLQGVPSNADAVVLNVTVTNTTGSSYLSIWPTGLSQPTASSLNWTPGVTIPNAVTVKLGAGGTNTGKISVFNKSGTVDVITDAAGWFG
jgi:hypothetical protein